MAEVPQKLTSPLTHVVDAILVIGFFILMFFVLVPHIPSHERSMQLFWGVLSSACMSGVFWLAIHMCRVVYRFQRDNRRH